MTGQPKFEELLAAMSAPALTEITTTRRTSGKKDQWITRWWCFVPAKGTSYTVVREQWVMNVPVGTLPLRDIFEIEIKREPELPGQDTLPGPWPEPVKDRKPGG